MNIRHQNSRVASKIYLGKAQLSPSLTSLALSIGQGMFRFSPAIPLHTDLSTGSVWRGIAVVGEEIEARLFELLSPGTLTSFKGVKDKERFAF